MNKKYIKNLAVSKKKFHLSKAKMPFEEKINIIIALQKLDAEMAKINKSRCNSNKQKFIWQIDTQE
ncbi:MAG: hypothetical protein AB1394_14965 [Bacteroidota bacterium]